MSEHRSHVVERHCDVLVVGGGAAGLAAALQLGRQGRSAFVVDAGEPRNAPAAHVHGYLGREGTPPAELVAVGRSEVRSYGGEVLDGRVLEVTSAEVSGEAGFALEAGGFRARLTGGHSITARRVLVATGLVDVLPDIEGVAAQWGRGVIHCPFCHGYEVRDGRIVAVVTHPTGLHPLPLLRQLTDRLTVVVHVEVEVDESALDVLRAGGVRVVHGSVARVVSGPADEVTGVELEDGERLDADAVVVGPRFRVRIEPFEGLGLRTAPHPSGLGDVVDTDDGGATSVPGVWAAGNVSDPSQQVLSAAADGSRVGAMISLDLAEEDLRAAGRRTSTQIDWDHRYAGDRMWSGNPNGALVAEIAAMGQAGEAAPTEGGGPGRALDVGAGEGGDAIWLAERGWAVTADDISAAALDRIGEEAERRGLDIERLHADANDRQAFGSERFDLVNACYASIRRTADDRAIANLLDAVAPGGTLLVVSHDLEPMRAPLDTRTESRGFDPDAYVRVEDVRAALAGDPSWTIEVDETRSRPPGAASAHHVDDAVLRARRAGG